MRFSGKMYYLNFNVFLITSCCLSLLILGLSMDFVTLILAMNYKANKKCKTKKWKLIVICLIVLNTFKTKVMWRSPLPFSTPLPI